MTTVGFVGLGNMGGPMAMNLINAGYHVRGFDLSSDALERAQRAGVEIVKSIGDVAANAEAVITMLPAGPHVLETYCTNLFQNAAARTLFIDCSTIDVTSARKAHAIAQSAGMVSLDAPVSGGVGGATNGTLTFMVGGDPDVVRRSEPILSAMGKKIVHCGDAGTGQVAKMCNNMILGISMIATSEAFVLGEKLGISAKALFDVISVSSGQCWSVTTYCPVPGPVPTSPANNGYQAGFAASLMLKDLKLARDAAGLVGADTALGRQATDIYSSYEAAGFGATDFSGVISYIRSQGAMSEPVPPTFQSILVGTRGRVGLITLNRPNALNAHNLEVMKEVTIALDAFDTDPAIGCIVLTGSEKAFAAGADIKEVQPQSFTDMYLADWFSRWAAVERTRKPIIAAVSGYTLGGGFELAMACDFILAADTAKFGQPEIKLGVIPGMGGSQRLTRAIGKSKAMELCLTGRMMDAYEAERSGLVARVVPAAQLVEDALKTADSIASMPLPASMMVKEAVNRSYELALEATVPPHFRHERSDRRHGRVFEKRAPGYSHS